MGFMDKSESIHNNEGEGLGKQMKKTMDIKIKIDIKKTVFLLCQFAILLLPYFFVWSDTPVLLGAAAIIVQYVWSLKYTGWAGACGYILTYWLAGILDRPQDGNMYVYWYLSYFAIVGVIFVVELVGKSKKRVKVDAQN